MNKTKIDLNDNLILRSENVEYNNDTLKNYLGTIIESGSNSNGNWIKYIDGTMICERIIPINNITINTAWGSLYYYDDTNTYTFAQEFIDTPTNFQQTIVITSAAGCWLGSYGNQVLTKSGFSHFCLIRPDVQTVTGKLFVKAIGKWK